MTFFIYILSRPAVLKTFFFFKFFNLASEFCPSLRTESLPPVSKCYLPAEILLLGVSLCVVCVNSIAVHLNVICVQNMCVLIFPLNLSAV